MELDILDSLEDLSFEGAEKEESKLKDVLSNGEPTKLAGLVAYLSGQLQSLLGLESSVTQDENAESLNFLLEVSSLLKELSCPYSQLMEGPLEKRLDSEENRILLLDFLCSEVQAAHVVAMRKKDSSLMEVDADSGSLDQDLQAAAKLLGLTSENPRELVTMLADKLKEILPQPIPDPLLSPDQPLTPEQWDQLSRLDAALSDEYQLRRQMLITRLDSTIASFGWSDRLKDKQEEITAGYLSLRTHMRPQPNVHLADLLSARADLLEIEKTSSANLRRNTRSSVNKVVIGPVPDRGGRTDEAIPPPPEMPFWKKRGGPPGGGGFQGGGRGRGGGGNRHQQRGGGKFHDQRNRDHASNSYHGGRRRY